jgi:hypothetical protein
MSSFCSGCGNSLAEGETVCGICGKDSSSTAATPAVDPAIAFGLPPENSSKAIFSLGCGLLYLLLPVVMVLTIVAEASSTVSAVLAVVCMLGFPLAIVAIIFAYIARSDIRRSAGRLKGKGLALAGLILGYVGIAGFVALIIVGVVYMRNERKRVTASGSAGSTGSTARGSGYQPPAVVALRTLNTAEIAYSHAHPAVGYTCSMDDLAGAWAIRRDIEKAQKSGYVIALQGCTSAKTNGAVTKYQVTAYPAPNNKTKSSAYCSDQSDVIKVIWSGASENCLSKGGGLY